VETFDHEGCETGVMDAQSRRSSGLRSRRHAHEAQCLSLAQVDRRTRTHLARELVPRDTLTIGAIRSSRWADNAKERLFLKLLAGLNEQNVKAESRTFALEHSNVKVGL